MKKLIAIIILLIPVLGLAQKSETAMEYAATITQEDLYDHLSIIASDAFEGRETGTRGQKIAAAYIKAHFESLGLAGPVDSEYGNGYYQRVPLFTTGTTSASIEYDGKEYVQGVDLLYRGSSNTAFEGQIPLTFAGDGSEESLAGISVEGSSLFILQDSWRSVYRGLSSDLRDMGVEAIFVLAVDDEDGWNSFADSQSRGSSRLSLANPELTDELSGIFFVSPAVAEKWFGSAEELKSAIASKKEGKKNAFRKYKDVILNASVSQNLNEVPSENVLGYLEGSDLKDELLVITAHYDHVGRRGDAIYNGADDDGSGTVTVLELAEAFVKAKKEGNGPRRSILFMTVTGEEKGLLGSSYYTSNPIFPLENTVTNLNIDMIGRIDQPHKEDGNYVYLVGSDRLSSELHEISEKVNETYSGLALDYTFNDESHPDRIYYRSDHWNFAKNNVPIIFYFTGVHEDYHRPTDTVDKIEFELLEKRAQLVFHTAWVLSNRDERPVVDKIKDSSVEVR